MKSFASFCVLSLALSLGLARAAEQKTENKEPSKTAGAVPVAADKTASSQTNEVVVIKTTEGEMVIEFWPDVAPKTVENFKTLARKGFYDGTAFHRVVKGFMIQGGDPNTKDPSKADSYGNGGPGYNVKAEFNNRKHERGVISMARSSDPNSAGSQFFICQAPADNPNMQYLNGKYTAFGKLIKGDDVLEKIANMPVTGPNAMGEYSIPRTRIGVESIKIVPANSAR